MKFKVMTNDIGPNAYSCFMDIEAGDLRSAKEHAKRKCHGLPTDGYPLRILVLPFDKLHLHDGRTGKIHRDAECFIVGHK
jgi:hypothetical protein